MVLIKQTETPGGTEFLFTHYQDAYKKAQRIKANTGYNQTPSHTSEGYTVIEPKSAKKPVPQAPQQMSRGMPQMLPPGGDIGMMDNIPTDIGYEFPPRQPPGLYDGKW